MEALEKNIKQLLIGKAISNIKLYNINNEYYAFYEESHWVFDGGIQFNLDNSIACWGYNYEIEMFEFSFNKEITEYLANLDYYQIETKNIEGVSELQRAKIKDVDIKWQFYRNIDENLEPIGEKIYVPIEIILHFDFNMTLQLALIDFEINEKPFMMVDPTYTLEGEMLYSFNKEVKITNANPREI